MGASLSAGISHSHQNDQIYSDDIQKKHLDKLRVGTNEYDFKNKQYLGEGGMGTVYKIKCLKDGGVFAIKQLSFIINQDASSHQKEQVLREVQSLGQIYHPFIVELFDWFKTPEGHPCIVMECCEGSLQGMFKQRKEQQRHFQESEILRILTMISVSLSYIHNKDIIHRDIKPHNILVGKFGDKEVYKLTDFGISQSNIGQNYVTLAQNMSYSYCPIEQIAEKEAHKSFDIWGLGITMYQLMKGKLPYNKGIGFIINEIKTNERDPLNNTLYSQDLINLVNDLLTINQIERPSIQEVLNTPIMRKQLDILLQEFLPFTQFLQMPRDGTFIMNQIKQSQMAHELLSQIVQIQCENARNPRYQISDSSDSQLQVSGGKEKTKFLQQAEINAIQNGLKFKYSDDKVYKGYINKQGQMEGVGILKKQNGIYIGEFKEGVLHGCVRLNSNDGHIFFGHYYKGKRQGYGIYEWPNGEKYMGQWKDSLRNGYGVDYWEDERMYNGMHENDVKSGWGRMTYYDSNIYYGKYQNGCRNGRGYYIDSETKQITKRLFKQGKELK